MDIFVTAEKSNEPFLSIGPITNRLLPSLLRCLRPPPLTPISKTTFVKSALRPFILLSAGYGE
jgi:hypothetical protein